MMRGESEQWVAERLPNASRLRSAPMLPGMAIQHAVLALLAQGSSYGYELKASFEQAVGPQWGGLNIGHLYQILDRLERDGQVVVSETVVQEGRPDRQVYEITPDGRAALDEWLASPTDRSSGYRDDFILKVLAASQRGSQVLREVCDVQRHARMSELGALRTLRRSHADEPLALLTIEAAIAHVQAELAIIDKAEAVGGQPLLPYAPSAQVPAESSEPDEQVPTRRRRTGT